VSANSGDRRNSLRRIKPGNFVQFPAPIIADSGRSSDQLPNEERRCLREGRSASASAPIQLFALIDVGERANERVTTPVS